MLASETIAGVVVLFVEAYLAPDPPAPTSKYTALSVEQAKAQSANINYELLARSPTTYTGQLVTFRGKVVQAVQGGLNYALRVNVWRKVRQLAGHDLRRLSGRFRD